MNGYVVGKAGSGKGVAGLLGSVVLLLTGDKGGGLGRRLGSKVSFLGRY